jgi:hypothetical protein
MVGVCDEYLHAAAFSALYCACQTFLIIPRKYLVVIFHEAVEIMPCNVWWIDKQKIISFRSIDRPFEI